MSGGHWKHKNLKDAKYDMDTFNLLRNNKVCGSSSLQLSSIRIVRHKNACLGITGQSSLTPQKRKATILIKSLFSSPRTKKLNNT